MTHLSPPSALMDVFTDDDVAPLMRVIETVPIPRGDEQRRLAEAARAGSSPARERLIVGNMRLVAKISTGYLGRGMSHADLIQEGTIGLMRAVDKFEPARGLKLSTYATWWIRQSISRALAERGRVVRLPIAMADDRAVIIRAEQSLGNEDAQVVAGVTGLPAARVREVRACSRSVASLDLRLGDDGATLGEMQVDRHVDVAEDALARVMSDHLYRALSRIGAVEAAVLGLSEGLDGARPRTVGEIADLLKIPAGHVAGYRDAARDQLARALGAPDDFPDKAEPAPSAGATGEGCGLDALQ